MKTLVVDDKWLAALDAASTARWTASASSSPARVKELAERYETPLPKLTTASPTWKRR